jgi:hypothetical protein
LTTYPDRLTGPIRHILTPEIINFRGAKPSSGRATIDDLSATVADLKARGVAFAAEGIESPVCDMAIVKDPDGNAIILHKLKRAEEKG